MLAIIAKCFGYKDPIGEVRWEFNPDAIETAGQEEFIETFDVSEFRRQIFVTGFLNWWRGE
jgi:hypothetical protein